MARLAAQEKMGHYPTPDHTLSFIKRKICLSDNVAILDPCCGNGNAALSVSYDYDSDAEAITYGIEVDTERADTAAVNLNKVLCGSIYDVIVRPLECFSMLYLNPPYEYEDGERMEYLFLKHCHKWLMPGGLLVYLVPESILYIQKVKDFLRRKYKDIRVYRFTEDDYPRFKQIVLFGVKLEQETDKAEFPLMRYHHIENTIYDGIVYKVFPSNTPSVYELKTISPEDIQSWRETAFSNIRETLDSKDVLVDSQSLSPLFPLRKGHVVSKLMGGDLDGRLVSGEEEMIIKSFTDRQRIEREEEGKLITTDIYQSVIRVLTRGGWFDVK